MWKFKNRDTRCARRGSDFSFLSTVHTARAHTFIEMSYTHTTLVQGLLAPCPHRGCFVSSHVLDCLLRACAQRWPGWRWSGWARWRRWRWRRWRRDANGHAHGDGDGGDGDGGDNGGGGGGGGVAVAERRPKRLLCVRRKRVQTRIKLEFVFLTKCYAKTKFRTKIKLLIRHKAGFRCVPTHRTRLQTDIQL